MALSQAVLITIPNDIACSARRKPPPLRLSSANSLHAIWSPNFEPSAVTAHMKYKEARAMEAAKAKELNTLRLKFNNHRKAFNAAINRNAQCAMHRDKIASELYHSQEAAAQRARAQLDLKRFKAHDVSARVKYVKKFISSKNQLMSQTLAASTHASLDAAALKRESSIMQRRSKAEKFTRRHAMNLLKARESEEMKAKSIAEALIAKMENAEKIAKAAVDGKVAKAKSDVEKVVAIVHAKHDEVKEKEKEINMKLSAAAHRHDEAIIATKAKAASFWSRHVTTVASVTQSLSHATMTLAKNIEDKLNSAAERRQKAHFRPQLAATL